MQTRIRSLATALALSAPITCLGLGLAARSLAADEPPKDSPAATPEDRLRSRIPSEGIEEITVTARKREERLQSTPISMVAFGEEELEGRQINSVTDLGQAVPNLKLDLSNGSNNQTRIYIRGVGQDDFRDNVDPGVGLYVDGVYISRLTGSVISTLDVEGIEVLRGPQGTLFGKNTVGGVIALRTRKPEPEFGGFGRVRVGNFGLFETQASVNVPLIPERAFARVTLETQTDEGFTRNSTTGTRSGDNKLLKGRVALRILPRDDMSLDLSYEQTQENEKTPTPECRLGNPFAPGNFLTQNFAVGPNGENFVDSCNADRGDDEPLTASANFDAKEDLDTKFAIANFSWDLSDNLTFRSVSSWRRVEIRSQETDLDATAVDGFGVGSLRNQDDTFSQEFQLNGRALDGRVSYTTGLYAFKEKGHGNVRLSSLGNALAAIRAGQTGMLFFPGSFLSFRDIDAGGRSGTFDQDLAQDQGGFLTDAVLGLNQSSSSRFDTLSLAGFVEATFDLTDRFSLTAGARYTTERKERQGKTIPLADAPLFGRRADRRTPTLGVPVSERFGKWTPRVQLEFQATDSIFAYASYSRGFKSGGFNRTTVSPRDRRTGGPRTTPEDPGKFEEEVLNSYEVGLKTQWFDNRLVVNLAGFYNRYDDIQLTTIQINEDGVPTAQINNVGEATIRGLELDFQLRPLPQLTFSGGAGLTDSDYRDFTARVDAGTQLRNLGLINPDTCKSFTPTDCDLGSFLAATGFVFAPGDLPMADFSDLDRTNTPNFNANLSVSYIFDLATWGMVMTRATYFVQGDVEYATFNDDDVRQDRYGLLDGRIAWVLPDGETTISFFGRNLLDRSYLSGGFSLNDTNGVKTVFRSRPRSYGIEIARRF